MDLWYSNRGGTLNEQEGQDERFSSLGPVAFGWKPEGFWVEIADLCIRVMDCFGAYDWEFGRPLHPTYKSFGISRFIAETNALISRCYSWNNSWESGAVCRLECAITDSCQEAESHGVNLLELIDLKHEYNKTRQHRHGGKLA
jgi:hypothetical protein